MEHNFLRDTNFCLQNISSNRKDISSNRKDTSSKRKDISQVLDIQPCKKLRQKVILSPGSPLSWFTCKTSQNLYNACKTRKPSLFSSAKSWCFLKKSSVGRKLLMVCRVDELLIYLESLWRGNILKVNLNLPRPKNFR